MFICACKVTKKKMAETIIFGGMLTTVAGEGEGSAVCSYQGTNAMVIDGCGKCTAPVPAGYTVA